MPVNPHMLMLRTHMADISFSPKIYESHTQICEDIQILAQRLRVEVYRWRRLLSLAWRNMHVTSRPHWHSGDVQNMSEARSRRTDSGALTWHENTTRDASQMTLFDTELQAPMPRTASVIPRCPAKSEVWTRTDVSPGTTTVLTASSSTTAPPLQP
jgi:hypothetical protein